MTRIRNAMWLLIAVVAAAFMPGSLIAQEIALTRFIHLDANQPALDITLNGELAAADLRYGEASVFINATAGAAELSTRLPATTVTLETERTTLPAGPATVLLAGTGGARFHIVSQDLSPIASGSARLALFNALDAAVRVTVSAADEPPALAADLSAGSASSPLETSAGAYAVRLETAGGELLAEQVSQTLAAGTVNLLIIHGSGSEPVFFNAVAAAEGDAESSHLRFIHAIAGAAPVDLRVNGELAAPGLSFAAPSPHIAYASGATDIAVNLGAAEILSERLRIRAGEMRTVVLMRAGASLGLFHFADAIAAVDQRSAVVNLINAIPDSVISHLQMQGGAIIALNVPANEASGAAEIVAGRQAMTLHLNIGGDQGEVAIPPYTFHGGSYYTLVALAGSAFSAPRLLIAETSLKRHIGALPADIAALDAPASDQEAAAQEPAMVEPSAERAMNLAAPETDSKDAVEELREEPAAEQTADAIEQDPAPGDPAPSAEPSSAPYATVKVNPDTALHMREYPSSDALSLGLLPAESHLLVLGRRGPSQLSSAESTALPVDLNDYQRDAAADLPQNQDLPAADTWLYVIFTTRDGGAILGWANAYYLEVFSRASGRQWLAHLPLVPQNRPGGARSADSQPATQAHTVAARVEGLNRDAFLNLRRGNDVNSAILTLLPAETTMRLLGLDEAEAWAFVEYQPTAGNPIRGWVDMSYIQLLLNNAAAEPDALRTLDPDALRVISGATTGGVLPSVRAQPEAPIEGIVGQVNVNVDSALHLRRYPDAAARSLALLPSGAVLRLEGVTESGGWYKVQYQGEAGWVAAAYLLLSKDGIRYAPAQLEGQLPRFSDQGF